MSLPEIKLVLIMISIFVLKILLWSILFVLCWLFVHLLKNFVDWILTKVGFDNFCREIGIEEFLRKGQVSYTPSKLAAMFVYWLVIIVILISATSLVSSKPLDFVMEKISQNIPITISSLVIAIIGILLSNFIGNFVETIANNANFLHAKLLGNTVKVIGIFFIMMITLEFLGLGEKTIIFAFQIVWAGFVFALALALGLGCKDIMQKYVERFLKKMQEGKPSREPDLEG